MTIKLELANSDNKAEAQLNELVEQKFASRIYESDATIWGPEAESEASIRLNWLFVAEQSEQLISAAEQLRAELKAQGVNRIILSGMGGSSLAPEVIANWATVELVILDSTEPSQIESALIGLENSAVIFASKSGSTVETDSHRRIFEAAYLAAGIDPKDRIIIITDPGSPFHEFSVEKNYRVFLADPKVGGRFSALTAFGLVPSVLAGVDAELLIESAQKLEPELKLDQPSNPGLKLAAAIASNWQQKNKLILVEDPKLQIGFGDWLEQLVAESTGKEQKGLLPVIVPVNAPELAFDEATRNDFVVVWLGSADSAKQAGVEFDLAVSGELGELFLLWEFAVAAAGVVIGINPFDQPDVESAKQAARQLLDGAIAEKQSFELAPGIRVEDPRQAEFGLAQLLNDFLAGVGTRDYLAIQLYLNRLETQEFSSLRDTLAAKSNRPVTIGWGPRFLHSTGQYHKGGTAEGNFLQLVADSSSGDIPGREFSLGQLLSAQAAGDAEVLRNNDRTVISLRITDPKSAFVSLTEALSQIGLS